MFKFRRFARQSAHDRPLTIVNLDKDRSGSYASRNMNAASVPPSSKLDLSRSHLRDYASTQHLVVRNLISPATAALLDVMTRSLPGRRVTCRNPDVTWEEQSIGRSQHLYGLFSGRTIRNAVAALLGGGRQFCDLTCWVSRYRVGEYISPHTDAAGTLQVLLMLKPVKATQGGVLKLSLHSEFVTVDLREGDALFFCAATLVHFTTPLTPTPEDPLPLRVVAAGRYFFERA